MNKMHVKKGDTVVVITGKDKGKTGPVLRAFPKTGYVLIDGVNVVKKHQRAKKGGQKGQIVQHPMPIHASNVRKGEGSTKPRVTRGAKPKVQKTAKK